MTRIETKLRSDGDALFLQIERYRGEEANGKVNWTKAGHEDVNLSCQLGEFSLCRLVSDGILTPDEAADLPARALTANVWRAPKQKPQRHRG